MSLRTGHRVATTDSAIINPNNLKIEGFYCIDSMEKKKLLVLLYQDIRDIIPQGIVVDDHDVLTEPSELVRLQDILKLHFELLGKPVETTEGKKIGKVSDFAAESATLYVQKIYVSPTLFGALGSSTLSVDRSQIHEITSRKIVIQPPLQPTKAFSGAPVIAN